MKNCGSFEHKDTKAQSRYRKANITKLISRSYYRRRLISRS
jgi:hypothetical protein